MKYVSIILYEYSIITPILSLSILTWLFLSKEKTSTSCDLLTFLIENHNSNPPTPNYWIILKKKYKSEIYHEFNYAKFTIM